MVGNTEMENFRGGSKKECKGTGKAYEGMGHDGGDKKKLTWGVE